MESEQLSAVNALYLVQKRCQWMRENGEHDMRSVIYMIAGIIRDIEAGKPSDEIIAYWAEDEEGGDDGSDS